MTHGGTSFGHWAGANNTGFAPDCTSYDYDAPINEQGAATEKYYQLRALLQKYSATKLPAVPKAIPVIAIPEVKFTESAKILCAENLPQSIASYDIEPMEQFDQGYGSIMYSTTLPAAKAGALLQINDMCDYALVYIDGKKVGELYRGNGYETTLRLKQDVKAGAKLDIFIEAMGRINYSKLIHDPKGITKSVELLSNEGAHEVTYNLKDWQISLFPVSQTGEGLKYSPITEGDDAPAFYRASFTISKVGDTYLDMSTWGKGLVWINGHCLGRFWQVGPQQTLYVPGCWLRKGKNDITVLDITGPSKATVKGLTNPNVSDLHREYLPKDAVKGDALKAALAGRGKSGKTAAVTDGGAGNDAAPGAK